MDSRAAPPHELPLARVDRRRGCRRAIRVIRIDDITVNIGPFPLSETPFTHTFYDRDGGFLDLVVREVRKVADAHDVDRPLLA